MDSVPENVSDQLSIASIPSRLLAMAYDSLIILFITAITVFLIQLIFIGNDTLPPDHVLNDLLKPIWFIPGFLYFSYYWRSSGETPSMKVWKIKLIDKQGKKIAWSQALLRYIFSLLGLGLFLALFNKNKYSLQDIISGTSIIQIKQ